MVGKYLPSLQSIKCIRMVDVPIYNKQGEQVDTFHIDDDTLEYVNGRVNKGSKCYYKGSGYHTTPTMY